MEIWTKEHFVQALTDLGVEVKSGKTTDLDKALSTTLKERNPKSTTEELAQIRSTLFTSTSKRLSEKSGNNPTPKVKSTCPTFGKAFDPNSAECKDCKDGAPTAAVCKSLTAQSKTSSSQKKVKAPAFGDVLRKTYKDFDDLKDHLKKAPGKRVTMALNKLLLQGFKLSTLVKKVEEAGIGNDFKDPARVKSHVRYMEKLGWEFEWGGEHKDIVKLVGYKSAVLPAEEQKAA